MQFQPNSTSNSDSDLFPSETRLIFDPSAVHREPDVDSIPVPNASTASTRAEFYCRTSPRKTRPARPRTAGAAAWQLCARGLDAHGIRTRTECAPSATCKRHLVPGASCTRLARVRVRCAAVYARTMRDEGDGEHRACALAAGGSRVERGWGMESDGERGCGQMERECVDAPAGAGAARVLEGSLCRLRRTSVWAARPVYGAEFDVVSTRKSTMSVQSSKAVALALR
ncbi:hypothetical protein C8F04DRAFT_1291593 [Mycena alexandri]|uniref:Uncharacterized protein n=1 Tax=Mycena alexandri TaxID=1745969 RepID=A0AAD6SIP2_9AGAR|nr:hypothetical protein C8F04DRAFT_1291593 [Mycena alexandri]